MSCGRGCAIIGSDQGTGLPRSVARIIRPTRLATCSHYAEVIGARSGGQHFELCRGPASDRADQHLLP